MRSALVIGHGRAVSPWADTALSPPLSPEQSLPGPTPPGALPSMLLVLGPLCGEASRMDRKGPVPGCIATTRRGPLLAVLVRAEFAPNANHTIHPTQPRDWHAVGSPSPPSPACVLRARPSVNGTGQGHPHRANAGPSLPRADCSECPLHTRPARGRRWGL